MEIRQLKYFLAIAEAKNYSRAAESLFVTQPTLSLSMQKLEKEFDLSFFYQSADGLELTDAGLFLYENATELVQDYDSLIKQLHTKEEKDKETIRIGLTVLSAIQFMGQISKFIADNHNIEVRLIQTGSKKLQSMLADREIDFGILSFPLVEPSIDLIPLKKTEVQGYNVSVVMPSSNPLASKEKVSFKDLKDQHFISLSEDYMLGKLTAEKSRKYGFRDRILFIEDDWKVLLHSLENFDAVVLLPTEFKNFDETPNLSWIPLTGKNSYYPLGIARRKDIVVNETYHKFIEAIKQF